MVCCSFNSQFAIIDFFFLSKALQDLHISSSTPVYSFKPVARLGSLPTVSMATCRRHLAIASELSTCHEPLQKHVSYSYKGKH